MNSCFRSLSFLIIFTTNAFASDKIYYTSEDPSVVNQAKLDGSQASALTTASGALSVAVDPVNKTLYYTDPSNAEVARIGLIGTNKITVVGGLFEPGGLEVAGDKIYYSARDSVGKFRSLFEANLDGTAVRQLITSTEIDPQSPGYNSGAPAPGPTTLVVDGGRNKIYYVDEFYQTINRANLADGTKVETIVDLSSGEVPQGLTLDTEAGLLYYCTGGSIHRAKLDGSSKSTVVTFLDSCEGIDLDPLNQNIYVAFPTGLNGIVKYDISSKTSTKLAAGEIVYDVAADVDRPATPKTIPMPAQITVRTSKVVIVMEKFKFGSLKAATATKKKKAPEKFNVLYESATTRTKDAAGNKRKDVIKKKDKRNVLTLKNLNPGTYTTKYRGVLTKQKTGKTVTATKFSPTETFVIN